MLRTVAVMAGVWTVLATHGAGQALKLPDRETFLREARETLARSQQLWHRYAYTERRTEIHMNPFGRVGMGDTLVLEVRPSANPQLTYRRIIQRNGVAVSKTDLERQDAQHRAKVARAERQAGDEEAVARRTHDDAEARRRAQAVIDDVLNTLRFDLVRREVRDGRPAIVVSFSGKPGAQPATRQGRIAAVFKGNVWVDESSREVTYVRGKATSDVSFGGFIAKIYEGTEVVIDRQEIEPGVWMPTKLSLTGEVRALFRKAHIDQVIEWSDYRRLP
jgi:hypothetical protein